MQRVRLFSISIIFLISLSDLATAQQWNGLFSTNRAIDWSNAGAGNIPARSNICQTLGVAGQSASYSQNVSASQIIGALQSCAGSNGVVYLNPGIYTMTQTLFGAGVSTPSNVTLRGAGPTQTILKWTGTSNNCNGINTTDFCVTNGDSGALQYASNIVQVTGGVSKGSSSITLGTSYTGSASNLKVGALLAFGQADTGFSGYPPSGSAADNGNFFNCGQPPTSNGATAACTWGGNSNAFHNAAQTQIVTVTGISGSTVTFTPALYAPNWSMNQSPFVWFSSTLPVTSFGVENLQINSQSQGDIQAMFETIWTTKSWVKNVSLINNDQAGNSARKHVEISASSHITVRDSYMYGSSGTSESYGIDFIWGTSDSLAENNISQHIASGYITETGVGDVFGYNYSVDNFYNNGAPQWQQCDVYHHNEADMFNLVEGHEGICIAQDDAHGTADMLTYFRSYLSGHDPANTCPPTNPSCGTVSKIQNTIAFGAGWGARYSNVALSVFGDGVYANTYENVGQAGNPTACTPYPQTVLFSLNFANGNQLPSSPTCTGQSFVLDNDPLVSGTMMRWGNYDTVNSAVRTTSSETAASAPGYPGLSSPSTSWSSYKSLYLPGQPSWWGSMPWPAIGPDVSGGNVANLAGHVYHNPAANCYLNVLGGKTNGSSGPLSFDADSCYPTSAVSGGSPPPPPSNLTGTVQ